MVQPSIEKKVCALCKAEIEGFQYSRNIFSASPRKRNDVIAYLCASCSAAFCSDCTKRNLKLSFYKDGSNVNCPQCWNLFRYGPVYLASELNPEEIQKAIKTCLERLRYGPDKQTKKQAVETLAEMGEAGIEAFFSQINPNTYSATSREALDAIQVILKNNEPVAVKRLEEILAGEEQKNFGLTSRRIMSADLLAQINPTATAKLLGDIVVNEEEPLELRQKSAEVLGNIKDPDSVAQLSHILGEKKWNMGPLVATAAESLGKIGDVRAAEPLLGALKNPNPLTQIKVIEALGNLGDARAIELLRPYLATGQRSVRVAAARTLKKLNWQPSDEKEKAQQLKLIPGEKDRFCFSCDKPVGEAKSCPHCQAELISKPYSPAAAGALSYLFGGLMGGVGLLVITLIGVAFKHQVDITVRMLIFGGLALSSWKGMKVKLSTSKDLAVLKPKQTASTGGESGTTKE
jgi:hypothetical protein